ncbi:hypothetical protein BX616_002295 [Lobosporangium transversale]|uniref:Mss4 protein-domain-containing protein n=1 Tax=Lobosporangium transversale TaxID=64571 RepID=A0A1Y2GQY4_9FUNG|nr:Mss4 protein-domain-containing protein [Lobosporangium transversale]KAF9901324.1 hypothetical protein BX616_002295 [Lobosporangium transversale]ORZ19289.1 Mss4 protein-domain-containing protein [Lobosporangium transversale]|eukprot:XP_021882457.1 Mss4 protein-domain-containing protein [Lobosporangium transversale]
MATATRNPGKEYSAFPDEQDLIETHAEKQVNKFDIYCPQESCRCKILLASAAELVQREKSKLALPKLPLLDAAVSTIEEVESEGNVINNDTTDGDESEKTTVTTTTTTEEELQSFWKVTNMMSFENIGFSKKLPNGIQFLSCADCDIGPLGYHDTSASGAAKEYLIALNRLRYHDRS